MRPTWLALVLAASACDWRAEVEHSESAFTAQAAACLSLEETTPLGRLREPCRYINGLADCLGLPQDLRRLVDEECAEHRSRVLGAAPMKRTSGEGS